MPGHQGAHPPYLIFGNDKHITLSEPSTCGDVCPEEPEERREIFVADAPRDGVPASDLVGDLKGAGLTDQAGFTRVGLASELEWHLSRVRDVLGADGPRPASRLVGNISSESAISMLSSLTHQLPPEYYKLNLRTNIRVSEKENQ